MIGFRRPWRRGWRPPELLPGDQLFDTEVVETNGRRIPIVLLLRPHANGGFEARGYSRSLDLPPGAHVNLPMFGVRPTRDEP